MTSNQEPTTDGTLVPVDDGPTKPSSRQPGFYPPPNWTAAPEFVPKRKPPAGGVSSVTNSNNAQCNEENPVIDDLMQLSNLWNWHAQIARTGALLPTPMVMPIARRRGKLTAAMAEDELCLYAIMGVCRYGQRCFRVHGQYCDMCQQFALHPGCREQQRAHRKSCMEEHMRDMEYSFRRAETLEKTCYICYDRIMDKEFAGDQRFGILPGCFHCFCLSCIRTWRQRAHDYESRVGRSCPVCRTPSDYVIPSRDWVYTPEEKERLIESYKEGTSVKPCRLFSGGTGFCPFGDKCFYLHQIVPPVEEEEVTAEAESPKP